MPHFGKAMDTLVNLFTTINDITWGWSLVPLLIIFGLFFTIASGFVQFTFFTRMFKVLLPNKESKIDRNKVSSLQALLVSVGGRVGGGNIAGVAVAITLGGPGAIFWMWMIAIIGMATSLFECSFAQLFKRTDAEGQYRGGPARYILFGLGKDYYWLAVLYAVCLIAAFGIGFPAFQGNTVAGAMQESFGLSRFITGSVFALLTCLVVYGGIQRIAKVSEFIVPIMATTYIAMTVFIIAMNLSEVPSVLWSIITNALGFEEAVGGGIGAAITNGVRRGLFSNEAGLGSAPNVAATAEVKHPITQGIVQSLSVFIDTMIICSCTAFIILLSPVYVPGAEDIDGIVLTQQSLVSHVGSWGAYFLSFAVLLFAFSSIIYNYYLGENALSVFTESKKSRHILRLSVTAIVFIGAVAPNATAVFFFSDPMMGILAIVNLLAIIMLFPIGKRLLADYVAQCKQGSSDPVFDPDKFPDLDVDRKIWMKYKEQ